MCGCLIIQDGGRVMRVHVLEAALQNDMDDDPHGGGEIPEAVRVPAPHLKG